MLTGDGDWYGCVNTVCKHLQDDHRCGIYETRPQICREYTTKECEYEDDWVYDQYFETCEQVEEYMDAVLGPGGLHVGDGRKKKNRGQSIRRPNPPLQPIASGSRPRPLYQSYSARRAQPGSRRRWCSYSNEYSLHLAKQ